MNTNEVADKLGISARQLRVFLRSPESTFAAVGSGARYDFTDRDLPTLHKRYKEWTGNVKSKIVPTNGHNFKPRRERVGRMSQADIDARVWAEEELEHGPVILPDIRDPRIRARVLRLAQDQEDRLMQRLMAVGLHVTQMGDRAC